jgi:hypothetical protein
MLPYVMATVLAKEERFSEVLDVRALLALATSDTNLHLVATLINIKLAPIVHITIGHRRNDLNGVREAARGLVWHGLSRHFCCNL